MNKSPYFKLVVDLLDITWDVEQYWLRSKLILKLGDFHIQIPLTLAQCLDAYWEISYDRYPSVGLRELCFGPFKIIHRNLRT